MSKKLKKPLRNRFCGKPYVTEWIEGSFIVCASKRIIEKFEIRLSDNINVISLKKKNSFILEIFVEEINSENLRTEIQTEIVLKMFFKGKISIKQGMNISQIISDVFSQPMLEAIPG